MICIFIKGQFEELYQVKDWFKSMTSVNSLFDENVGQSSAMRNLSLNIFSWPEGSALYLVMSLTISLTLYLSDSVRETDIFYVSHCSMLRISRHTWKGHNFWTPVWILKFQTNKSLRIPPEIHILILWCPNLSSWITSHVFGVVFTSI